MKINNWFIDLLIYWFIDILIYLLNDLLIYWFIDLIIYWFIELLTYWFIDLFFLGCGSWVSLISIWEFQPQIFIVALYGLVSLLWSWEFSEEELCRFSMQKWSVFTFMNGLMLLLSKISQSTLFCWFHLTFQTEQLDGLVYPY